MSNIHDFKICGVLVLLMTLCQLLHYSKGEKQFICECECIYGEYVPSSGTGQGRPCPNPVTQRPTAPPSYKVSERIEVDLYIPNCDEDGTSSFTPPPCDSMDLPCHIERNCCLGMLLGEDSFTYPLMYQLTCDGFRSGLASRLCIPDVCYPPTAQNCFCTYGYQYESTTDESSTIKQSTTSKQSIIEPSTRSRPSNIEPSTTPKPLNNNKSKSGFAIGLGVGIGICVFIAAHIALLVFCRLKGRGEGQGKAQCTLPKGPPPNTGVNRQGDNEEYAEIDSYVGDATMRAVANQAYSSSDVVITPDQANQAYTSLNDPAINSHQYKSLKKPNQDLGSGEYADPEKYTEPPVLPQRNSNAIDDEEDDEDYVSQGTPEPATNNDDSRDDYTLEPTAPSTNNINSSAQSNPKEVPTPSSDYVSVDTPDHPSPISPSSDYVSVDSPDNDTEENDISSDYVDF